VSRRSQPGRARGGGGDRVAGSCGEHALQRTLADGATWIADVPSDWNGVLLLYSHGFGPLTAADAPDPASAAALLDRGYALAGSSYDPNGSWWALQSAVRDQFQTIAPRPRTRCRTHRSRCSPSAARWAG
jgi:hypothetical protein